MAADRYVQTGMAKVDGAPIQREGTMAEQVASGKTSVSPEDVIVRAVQFFTTERWRAQTQSGRIATFVGRPRINPILWIATVVGLIACVIPGIILYIVMIRKAYAFQNIVVTVNPVVGGTEVVITHSEQVVDLVQRFLALLPPLVEVQPAASSGSSNGG
jgi:hypothetical protein